MNHRHPKDARRSRRLRLTRAASLVTAFSISAAGALGGAAGCGGSKDGSPSGPQGQGKVAPVRSLPQLDRASEDQLGQAVMTRVTQKYPVVDDPRLNQYVNLVGMTLAPATPQPDRDYTFGVVEAEEPATFSAPGGYVLITRGALRQMRDESELAGALAHELGHLVRSHGMRAALNAGGLDGLNQSGGDRAAAFGRAVDALANVALTNGYPQAMEIEADDEAMVAVTRTRYDPAGLLRYLERVQQSPSAASGSAGSPQGDVGKLGARVQRLKAEVKGATGATNEARFKERVKGEIFRGGF